MLNSTSTSSITALTRDIAKEADFVFDIFIKGFFTSANDNVREDTDFSQNLYRVLGGLCFDFTCSFKIGDIGQVDINAVATMFLAKLAYGL